LLFFLYAIFHNEINFIAPYCPQIACKNERIFLCSTKNSYEKDFLTYKVIKSGHPLHNRWDTAMKIILNSVFDITDNNPDFYIENINELCAANIIKFSTIEFYQNACGGLAPEKPEKQESKMLDEPLSEKVIVIPNPAVNMFTVETENKSPLKEVRIFDRNSKLVFYKQCKGASLQVTKAQLNNLPGMNYIQTLFISRNYIF
ncbi:MAG: hypothetical protein ABJA79_07235, partial [Parafilimonas sp.]